MECDEIWPSWPVWSLTVCSLWLLSFSERKKELNQPSWMTSLLLHGRVYLGRLLAFVTLGTRLRLAAIVASFKADFGGTERRVWGWEGEMALTLLKRVGRDWGVDAEWAVSDEPPCPDKDPRAESPDLLRDAGYEGLEAPEEEDGETTEVSDDHRTNGLLDYWKNK